MGRGVDHLEGKPVETEAVMLVFATADARNLLSLRLCRYPTEDTSWLWARVITPGGAWSRFDNYLPCTADRSAIESADVRYALADNSLVYRRIGPRANPTSCAVDGILELSEEDSAHRTVPVEIHATLMPRASHAGFNARRTEIMGLARATVRAAGSTWIVEGLGHFHEQPQVEPRFTIGFTYASFWGETISGVTLFSEGPNGGQLHRGGRALRVARFEVSAPAPERTVKFSLDSGETLYGSARVVHQHTISTYGKPWRGHFVAGEIAGERYAGMINDWRSETLPYLARG
ncbi:MAG TPA: hypothetical protein VEJ86_03510 [Candidatus Binataceae bacterium]|nr:hypothetical protein [Candidatus Binataceae bacterium]